MEYEKNCPKVTIAIPTYNRAVFLNEAIESSLRQDYSNLEIIISDNASQDNTSEIAKRYESYNNVFYHKQEENIGMVRNFFKILNEYSNGEWIIFLSDDDYFVDSLYISKAIDLIKKNEDVKLVYANGYIEDITKGKKEKLTLPYDDIEDGKKIFLNKDKIVKPQEFTLCNIIFNAKLMKQHSKNINYSNLYFDTEMFLKMCLLGKIGIIKDYVTVYRYHSDNAVNKRRTYDELIGIKDIFIEPYKLAIGINNIDKKELIKWKKRLLLPCIKNILLLIKEDYPKEYTISRGMLIDNDIISNLNIYLDFIYLFKLCFVRNKIIRLIYRNFKRRMKIML